MLARTRTAGALVLLSLAALAPPSAAQGQGSAPDPGLLKLPDSIVEPYLIEVGYKGATLRQNFQYATGGTVVSRIKRERENATSLWHTMKSMEGTEYFITGLTSTDGGDQMYLTGIRKDGTCIVERWSHAPRRSGWQVRYPLPASVDNLGDPAPVATPVVTVANGQAWAAPRKADLTLSPAQRRVIYETESGPLHGVAVDPQGRYLVTFDMQTRQLLQVNLMVSPPTTTILASPATVPGLELAGNLQVLDFQPNKRRILARRSLSDVQTEPETYLVGVDDENDGVFSDWTLMTETAWQASPYSDWDSWKGYDEGP